MSRTVKVPVKRGPNDRLPLEIIRWRAHQRIPIRQTRFFCAACLKVFSSPCLPALHTWIHNHPVQEVA